MKKIFLATKNDAKIQRFKNLLQSVSLEIEVYTPSDFRLENIETEENGDTLLDNAIIKARAYFGKVDMPILANDTGFWVEGEGLVDAPKRTALGGEAEKNLTKGEIGQRLLEFWRGIAQKHGGRVNAAWVEAFVALDPDGSMRTAESRREIILTDHVFGQSHVQMPVRALYLSKTTNRPAIQHTEEEELREMRPVINALAKVLAD